MKHFNQTKVSFAQLFGILSLVSVLSAPLASAHAHLVSSDPKAGSNVSTAPALVMLTFSEKIESKFSKVDVTDAKGKSVNAGKIEGGGEKGEMLHAPLKALLPGKYHVVWKATSADTHKAKGQFDFTVTGK